MMDDSAIHRARNTSRGWKVIGIFATAVLLLTGLILIIFFKDDPPSDDSRMLPVFSAERQDDNPLSQFAEYVVQHPPQGGADLSESAKKRTHDSTAEMQQHVDENATLLARWQELMTSDTAIWRWPLERERTNFSTTTPYLSGCQEITNRIAAMKVELLTREGRIDEAITLAQQILRYGYEAQNAEGSSVGWLAGLVAQHQGLLLFESMLTANQLDDQQLKEIQVQLFPFELDLITFQFALRMDYLSFKNTIGSIGRDDVLSSLDTSTHRLLRFFVRKNRTFAEYQHLALPLIEAAEKSPVDLFSASKLLTARLMKWRQEGPTRFLAPNAGGKTLLTLFLPILERIIERAIQTIALHRMTMTMIALRRYELAQQQLPEKLDELVPAYLSQVPSDPFDNQPLRWNPTTLTLYSVSSNLLDEDGLFLRSTRSGEADYGAYYWWSDKAKAQYKKEKLRAK